MFLFNARAVSDNVIMTFFDRRPFKERPHTKGLYFSKRASNFRCL